jgi:hypothetical protein
MHLPLLVQESRDGPTHCPVRRYGRDYDEALAFYVDKLGFERLEDTDLGRGE